MKQNNPKLPVSLKGVLPENLTDEQILAYLVYVRDLRNSGEAFPVDLDEVWPLVYPRKDHAVRLLKQKFIKGIEFTSQLIETQRFPKNEESKVGGDFRTMIYKLSVDCFQFLIARERKHIFKLYTKVFGLMMDSYTAINGVYPIIYRGRLLYPYREMLRAIGFSANSGAAKRRNRAFPNAFVKVGGRSHITKDMVEMLRSQYEYQKKIENLRAKQLSLGLEEA